jgi:transposase InsO family protein
MLVEAPELEAKALFEWLQEQKPAKYQTKQMRTFQRRVARWRALNQPQIATLAQVHEPGEIMELDGTWMTKLEVIIQGQQFKHMLIHCVLSYSNWEWGRIVQSESLGAVRLGLQSTLLKLGYVPRIVQTDNSSAATRQLGIREETEGNICRTYTRDYLQLLEHYGLEPQTIHVGNPNENADVESSHGALKRARLAEEIAVMKPLKATPLATSIKHKVRVSSGSLIRVLKKSYSVPTSLIGKEVTVYVHEWSLDVYYAGHLVDTLPRLIGQRSHHINYRHLIDTLLRKPGGFRQYRYREDLFPQLIFRQAWEQLNQWHPPRRADIIYLRVLKLAARTFESDVATTLEILVNHGQNWDETDVTSLVAPEPVAVPQLSRGAVELGHYDQLLVEFSHEPA